MNDITFGSASGAVTLTAGTVTLGGTTPTITVNNATSTIASQISGSAGLIKTGSGILILSNTANDWSGNTVVNGGVLQLGTGFGNTNSIPGGISGNPVTGSNLELNGGIVSYWFSFGRTLGTGDGEIQLTGGVSGFTQKQGDRQDLTFGTDGSEVQWGTATFNPTTLVLNDAAAGAAAPIRFNNALDLNGADRTVATNSTALTGNNNAFGRVIETGALLNYDIRNTDVGNTAALIKTGAGKLALDGTNTYDGGTTISQGGVLFDLTASMPATGSVTVADGTELIVSVGNAGEWTTGTSGAGTFGGLLAGDGGQTAAQVTYSGNVTVGVNTTTNQTYAGDIANVTGSTSTALSVYADDGSGQLTLSGNNSYTGATKLYDGATIVASSANALGNGGDITFVTGGTLTYTAATAGNDYGSRIMNSTAAIALNTNGQDVTLSGIAAGNTGGLTKTGTGTLTFTGTNTYSGATTLSAGTIAVYDGTLTTSGGAVSLASNTTLSVLGGIGVNSTWNLGNQDFQQSGSNVSNVQVVIDGDGVEGSAVLTNVKLLIWGRTITNSTLQLTDGGQFNVTGEVRIGNPYYSENGGANLTIGGGTATSTFSGDGGDDFYIG